MRKTLPSNVDGIESGTPIDQQLNGNNVFKKLGKSMISYDQVVKISL